MSSMKPRLITAALGLPLVVAVLILSEYFSWVMTIVVAMLCVLMTFEILSARKLHNNLAFVLPCVTFAFIEPLLAATQYIFIPIYVFITYMFFMMIFKNRDFHFEDISFAIVGVFLIVFGMMSIIMLSDSLKSYISFIFVLCVGVPWLADSGAYFAGISLGKHKLCPKISPNKTVEGFIGGLISGAIFAPLLGFMFTLIYGNFELNYILLFVLGFLCSLLSVLGDLTFSMIKRHCSIKDYGSIFPGHGGILDRFDSVIFVAPLVFLFCQNLPIILA